MMSGANGQTQSFEVMRTPPKMPEFSGPTGYLPQ
jgi:hypothetical protein